MTLLPGLHRDGRHDNGAGVGCQGHADVDELPRPQAVVGVWKGALDFDRSGGLIDGVVDERDAPRRSIAGVVGRLGLNANGSCGHVALECRKLRFRNRKRHVDRRHLVDDDERKRVVGADQIARVYHQRPGAARHRRRDRRVLQLDLRVLDSGAVGADRRVERRGVGRHLIDLLARRDAAGGEVLIASRLCFRVRRLRQISIQIRLSLLERCFEWTAVQREQHLALRDVVALPEIDRGELAGDLSVHGDVRIGFHRANHIDGDRHRLLLDLGDRYRHGRLLTASPSALLLRRDRFAAR